MNPIQQRRNTRSTTRKSNQIPESDSQVCQDEIVAPNPDPPAHADETVAPDSAKRLRSDESGEPTKKRKTHEAHSYGGHMWHVNKTVKGGQTIYYDCAELKTSACKVWLTEKKNEDGSVTYKVNNSTHTHTIDARDKDVKVRLQKAKKDAGSGAKPTRLLYGEALNHASDETLVQMPSQKSFGKQMRNKRKGDHPKAPTNLTELVLTDVKNSADENFLLFDSGPSKDRIIMFGTAKALEFMTKCEVLHMDGTVSSGPMLFDQLYTIHGSIGNWKMPLVFVLCTDKKTATYREIFKQLVAKKPTLKPPQINLDFELATIKAAKDVFPQTKLQGCLFHLAQAVVRNLGQHELKGRYENEIKFSSEIRQLIALAYLPIDKVISAFESLIMYSETLNEVEQEKDHNIAYFVTEYFEKNYVGKMQPNGTRKAARFPVELWNVHDSTIKGLARTNNVAEGWHNAFATMTGCQRPTIFKFIDAAKIDENISRGRIASCEAGLKGDPPIKKYAKRNEAIRASMNTYLKSVELLVRARNEQDDDLSADEDVLDQSELRDQWQNSPEFKLLMAIAHNSKL